MCWTADGSSGEEKDTEDEDEDDEDDGDDDDEDYDPNGICDQCYDDLRDTDELDTLRTYDYEELFEDNEEVSGKQSQYDYEQVTQICNRVDEIEELFQAAFFPVVIPWMRINIRAENEYRELFFLRDWVEERFFWALEEQVPLYRSGAYGLRARCCSDTNVWLSRGQPGLAGSRCGRAYGLRARGAAVTRMCGSAGVGGVSLRKGLWPAREVLQ
ncbi:hypothetical protein CYMTET_30080 [Cymbomonas tetramitiformis]|uniref:Uncharacterized protein n=1 Tax=Cymbomonas tetramitiformis TaxID=36881 RepID=A0AAE0FJI3_9CHLO|nr:hypothetical protein CYMTET_30080 [Cymbomonas tetramitiformis]